MSIKNILSAIVILLITIDLSAQVSFGKQQIISTTDSFGAIYSSDLDGDGDLYENIDGQGSLEKHLIAEWINNNQKIFYYLNTADLDLDGDLDIVGVTNNRTYWFENLDGQGNFSIPTLLGPPVSPCGLCIIDLDNDGDLDIITGTCSPGFEGLVWYENINGEGDFGPWQIILDTFTQDVPSVAINSLDVDEDGDIDLLFTSEYRDDIIWFPNLGSGNFDSPQIITNDLGGSPRYLGLNDIDGDNDLDLIFSSWSLSSSNYTIFWCENINNSTDFGSKQIIHQGPDYLTSHPSDLDSDGDIDLILMFHLQDGIFWYENIDGLGDFGPLQSIAPNEAAAVRTYTTDIDGDNDPDLFTISYPSPSYNLSWYENTSVLSVNANDLLTFSLYPVPVTEILHIESKSKIQHLRVYNSLGQMVQLEDEQISIDLSELNSGLFFVEVEDVDGRIEFKKIIKK